jgi:hypothetical protein
MTTFGVDVSHWQGMVDWKQVKSSGVQFAIIKSSQGIRQRDQYFTQNYTRAKAYGLLTAAYHYVSNDNAQQQARWIKDCLSDAWDTIAVILDWEDDNCTFTNYLALVRECDALGLRVVMQYVPQWFWSEMRRPDLHLARKLLMASRYPSQVASSPGVLYQNVTDNHWLSYGGLSPFILQFSDRAYVPGIKGPCDVDAFRGTIAELRELWYPTRKTISRPLIIEDDDMGSVPATVNGKTRIVIACPDDAKELILVAGFSDVVLNNVWFIGRSDSGKPHYISSFTSYLVKMDLPKRQGIPSGTEQITIETDTTIPWGWRVA